MPIWNTRRDYVTARSHKALKNSRLAVWPVNCSVSGVTVHLTPETPNGIFALPGAGSFVGQAAAGGRETSGGGAFFDELESAGTEPLPAQRRHLTTGSRLRQEEERADNESAAHASLDGVAVPGLMASEASAANRPPLETLTELGQAPPEPAPPFLPDRLAANGADGWRPVGGTYGAQPARRDDTLSSGENPRARLVPAAPRREADADAGNRQARFPDAVRNVPALLSEGQAVSEITGFALARRGRETGLASPSSAEPSFSDGALPVAPGMQQRRLPPEAVPSRSFPAPAGNRAPEGAPRGETPLVFAARLTLRQISPLGDSHPVVVVEHARGEEPAAIASRNSRQRLGPIVSPGDSGRRPPSSAAAAAGHPDGGSSPDLESPETGREEMPLKPASPAGRTPAFRAARRSGEPASLSSPEGLWQRNRNDRPDPSSEALEQQTNPRFRSASASLEQPTRPAGAVRHIRLQVPTPADRPLEVDISARGQSIRLAVRSSQSELGSALQENLDQLAVRMESHGLRSATWIPGDGRPSSLSPARSAEAGSGEFAGGGRDHDSGSSDSGGQRQGQRRNQPEWLAAPDCASDEERSKEERSWLQFLYQ